MTLPREVDFMPGGDYAFCVVRPTARQRAEIWFYDWHQVELDLDDGRIHLPKTQASVGNRELLQLAKYLLQAAGHDAAKDIHVPDQEWNQVGVKARGGSEPPQLKIGRERYQNGNKNKTAETGS